MDPILLSSHLGPSGKDWSCWDQIKVCTTEEEEEAGELAFKAGQRGGG